jgi:nitrite reductase/ring-hydroxylating ferredoxin subunit/uncharacterized membrane protein
MHSLRRFIGSTPGHQGDSGEALLDRFIRRQGWMDGLAERVQLVVGGAYGALGRQGQALKNLAHGTTLLGHPLHPAITDVPLGAWTVGVVADWTALATGRLPTQVGDFGLALGLAAAALAVVTGYTDFHETAGHERRTALAHGLTMSLVFLVDAASLAIRWWAGPDLHVLAVGLATLGLVLAVAGAYAGGHLTFGLGTMVNRNAFLEGPQEYVPVGQASDFPEGTMRRVDADGMPVLVVRLNGALHAIGAVCSHAGGPLDEGELNGQVVTCPWHGSRFDLAGGRARGGPATFGQPPLKARERDGRVEVTLSHPLH